MISNPFNISLDEMLALILLAFTEMWDEENMRYLGLK